MGELYCRWTTLGPCVCSFSNASNGSTLGHSLSTGSGSGSATGAGATGAGATGAGLNCGAGGLNGAGAGLCICIAGLCWAGTGSKGTDLWASCCAALARSLSQGLTPELRSVLFQAGVPSSSTAACGGGFCQLGAGLTWGGGKGDSLA